MPKFTFTVEIDTDTLEHAERVMAERCNYDEPYYQDADGEWWGDVHPEGATTFDYQVEWRAAHQGTYV